MIIKVNTITCGKIWFFMKMAGKNSEALLFVDAELAARPVATPPTGVAV